MPALISSLLVPIKAMPIRSVCVGYVLFLALDVNAFLVGTMPHFRIALLFQFDIQFSKRHFMFEHRIWSVTTFLRSRTCIIAIVNLKFPGAPLIRVLFSIRSVPR